MDRLFLDANVLFSAAYRSDSGFLQFWKLQDVVLCSSRYALQEAKLNLTEEEQEHRLAQLARKLQLFEALPGQLPGGVLLPPKDIPILLAAMEAGATHLITGDKRHFALYSGKTIAGILVQPPAAYLKTRSSR